tara:strand:- start:118 stop:375 length:258 start_codon:yes stop_codon:yes gene_type:complete
MRGIILLQAIIRGINQRTYDKMMKEFIIEEVNDRIRNNARYLIRSFVRKKMLEFNNRINTYTDERIMERRNVDQFADLFRCIEIN